MSNGKRRYFPGANTGRGFIGHFELSLIHI